MKRTTQPTMTVTPPRQHIRWMIRRDLREVLEIDGAGFSTSPLGEEALLGLLRQRDVIGMVTEEVPAWDGEGPTPDGPVLGFMVYRLEKSRLVLLRLAVHPAYRRQGVGRAMLAKLAGKLSSHRRTRIALDVAEGNLAAQLWLKACGFTAVRVDRGAADDGTDSYRFVYRLEGEGAELERAEEAA